jgi:hypothetical protein
MATPTRANHVSSKRRRVHPSLHRLDAAAEPPEEAVELRQDAIGVLPIADELGETPQRGLVIRSEAVRLEDDLVTPREGEREGGR